MENKKIDLPFHIKEKLRASANYHIKSKILDDYLIQYLKKNGIYNELKDAYENLVIKNNEVNKFIDIANNLYQKTKK